MRTLQGTPRSEMGARLRADWDLVCSYMHWNGANYGRLSDKQDREVRLLADGFGDLRGFVGPHLEEMLYDWSHVRDSSDGAVRSMAQHLRLLNLAR